MSGIPLIIPDWPAPPNVRAVITTRQGGVSSPPWDSLNLGLHVGDNPQHVRHNRDNLLGQLELKLSPQWLDQVHGTKVVAAVDDGEACQADACITRQTGLACAIMTADCLPLLLCDSAGSVVAAVHAGWKGLAAGVIRNTVAKMSVASDQLLVYLGPAISREHFAVGAEVRQAFVGQAIGETHRRAIADYFYPAETGFLADLYGLARLELSALGIDKVWGGQYCTFAQRDKFFSFRRDKVTGRMASLIWLL